MLMLKSPDGSSRFPLLEAVTKSGLIMAQTNAESERSLSINNRVVTKDRSDLGEETVVGLRTVKDAVHFFDPVNNQPEKIPITKELKASVRSSYAGYRANLKRKH